MNGNCNLITATVAALCLYMTAVGCSRSGRFPSAVRTIEALPALTADQARQAVLALIRSQPGAFIGSPDPDRLAQLPMEECGEARYAFGAFVVDLSNQRYSADIGYDAPELYSYSGAFTRQDGHWMASNPEVTRFHQRLD